MNLFFKALVTEPPLLMDDDATRFVSVTSRTGWRRSLRYDCNAVYCIRKF